MSTALEFDRLFSFMPMLSLFGLLLFGLISLAALVAVHYLLKLARQLEQELAAKQAIATQLRKHSTAVEHSAASIVITDRQGLIEYVNPAFCRLTGYALDELLGQNPRMLKGGDQHPGFYASMWDALLAGKEWRGEFQNKRKDGTLFWEKATISPIHENGEITHFVGVKENITERKNMLEHLDQLAHYDKLTGLPNRTLFFDRLECMQALSQRDGREFALLFIDLDGLKQVNDNYGHEAGDAVLGTVARRLESCIRQSDTASRMGGDEFTVILGNLDRGTHDAALVAEKILQALSAPVPLPGGESCSIGASVGISLYPEDSDDLERLLSAADTAMYAVKREGKNGYRFYLDVQRRSQPGKASLTLC
jgi:diguanylate cyclase (GGDEF)-like protein/PAS domain S-box-containing protein